MSVPVGLGIKNSTLSALVRLRKHSVAVLVSFGLVLTPHFVLAEEKTPTPQAKTEMAKPTPTKTTPPKTTPEKPKSAPAVPPARNTNLPGHYQKAPPIPAMSDEARAKAKRAFQAAREGAWSLARDLARDSGDPLIIKAIKWANMARPATNASFGEIASFVRANPDWPQQDDLERNAEDNIPADLTDQGIIDWFQKYPPHTFEGTRRYARALLRVGNTVKANQEVRRRWIDGPVPVTEQSAFLSEFKAALSATEHRARLDRLILDEHYDAAENMLRFVGDDTRALAEARIALGTKSPGVDGAVKRVPTELQNHPGLVLERVRWRRRNGLDVDAAQLLVTVAPKDSRDDVWWQERQTLARRMLSQGNPKLAYKIVSRHGHVDGLSFASAEWFSGWVALRYLNDPGTALRHFKNMQKAVETPISMARAAYWAGRAAQSAGQKEDAIQFFRKAAQHDSTFYGLLASGRIEAKPVLHLHHDGRDENDRSGDQLAGTEVYQTARRLVDIGGPALYYANYFMIRMRNDIKGGRAYDVLGRLALRSGQPGEAVKIGKAAINDQNLMLPDIAYPVRSAVPAAPESALIHAIIRQESLFNPAARSPVGALGLMQLMPDTARAMAKSQGVRHSTESLVRQPEHNVRLGAAYLQSLIRRYDGAYILAIAAYNAGPSRVNGWIADFGDPRNNNIDPIDWIERIPFTETRNYVHRVMENLQVYRARLHNGSVPITLDQDLRRGRIVREQDSKQ